MIGPLINMSLYKNQIRMCIPTWTCIPIKIWSASSEINVAIISEEKQIVVNGN